MTTTMRELRELRGADVYDRDDDKIGVIDEIFTDELTGAPEFLGIGTGFLRMKRALVPVDGIAVQDGSVRVPYEKDTVKDSPSVSGDLIDDEEARELYAHYRLESPEPRERMETAPRGGETAEVTRHEEELRVGKRDIDAGRIRLRKMVETDEVTTDVDLERETAEVTRERIDRPSSSEELGEKEIEVPLREQEPVVEKDTVAKERVAVDKDVEHQRQPVSEEVRKERVEVEDDTTLSR